ncbi:MAG: NnrS family protein [Xanthomonadales bacterium]|nr:NnrS family protein [Xanthomonadales bacterium]
MSNAQTETPSPRFVPFGYGLRPFFLLAGWFAVLAIGLWLWFYGSGRMPLPVLMPQFWHGHEMLFGFVPAAVAGFLLTAVPSWTGSRGFAGWPLIALTAVWLAGRIVFLAGSAIPFALLVLVELAFLPLLAALIAPALLRATNRNTPMLLVLLVFWLCDASFLYALHQADPLLARLSLVAALDVILLLITIIGGRIVPAFTGNALRQRGLTPQIRKRPALEYFVIGAMAAMLLVDLAAPYHWLAGLVAAAAGLAQAWRLSGWQGHRTLGQPLVWVLHAAYAWLPLGLLLKAAYLLGGFGWSAFWLHALGAGAAATMILAVMSRASLGHTGRPLQVGPAMAAAYVMLILAALVRVFGPALLPIGYISTLLISASLWVAAFLVYSIIYTPILLKPRVDGKPG